MTDIAALDADLDAWIEEGMRIRAQVWEMPRTETEASEEAQLLGQVIEIFEANRLREAKDLGRMQKAFRRDQKAAEKISKSAADILREVDGRLLSHLERSIEARLEFALFMRAHRAELDTDSRGGPVFDNTTDLEAYLNSIMAS
ncbi:MULTISPECIES: hypothetical protein [unclassified Sinorhizobium]|uniref:hypothetical protein n=1 Tax=unclassified Sinorhizobium TaxID=2613772 RepID=UPI0024C411FE|nr:MULTISPECIES: hypothetical protein [unclassified Sinorhizobium]MDK1377081.1 hypothetical protein [Sinorhizobium sp. 6-70]MDK1479624.1 hypothetical protein [Sinorhizobium sp. 6-117]